MLFNPGRVVATPGAIALIDDNALHYLSRHCNGDWGDVCKEDSELNDESLKVGNRLLSSYLVGDEKLWVITEADRSVTTLLLPEEY
tara:strand:- start:1270 stop:1527 length:258 start_codon:yes stop_codon:yes gene_type:complete